MVPAAARPERVYLLCQGLFWLRVSPLPEYAYQPARTR